MLGTVLLGEGKEDASATKDHTPPEGGGRKKSVLGPEMGESGIVCPLGLSNRCLR